MPASPLAEQQQQQQHGHLPYRRCLCTGRDAGLSRGRAAVPMKARLVLSFTPDGSERPICTRIVVFSSLKRVFLLFLLLFDEIRKEERARSSLIGLHSIPLEMSRLEQRKKRQQSTVQQR